ncbi:MAG TPA: hypothetical protein VFT98_13335 [Myxococcota bacterium]|nr:hypothetical protein [Myxococcota bacterium]
MRSGARRRSLLGARALFGPVAVLLVWIAGSAALAGPLLSATYIQSAYGGTVVRPGVGATGSFDGTRFTLDPGSAFSGTGCIGFVAGCSPLVGTQFVPPISRLDFSFGANGALSGTIGQASIPVASGIHGTAFVRGRFAKMTFTFLTIPLNVGATSVIMRPTTPSATTLVVTVFGDGWHLGQITATGNTVNFSARNDVMATGGVTVTAAGNTHLNLVSLTRVKVRGLTANYLAFPTYLQLTYAPEPALAGMLCLASIGLAAAGRKRRPAPEHSRS